MQSARSHHATHLLPIAVVIAAALAAWNGCSDSSTSAPDATPTPTEGTGASGGAAGAAGATAAGGATSTGGGGSGGGGAGGAGGAAVESCTALAPETTSYDFKDNVAPSAEPPGGLPVEEVPQFVSFGWDDNGRVDGFEWAVGAAGKRKNRDGTPVHMTFFYTSKYIESNTALLAAWKKAGEAGHEVGLHSVTHETSKDVLAERWTTEVTGCIDRLLKLPTDVEAGPGFARTEIFGWRTPFLGTNDALLPVLKSKGVWYDASLEEGYQYDQDGTNFVWPYTLDDGSPGDQVIASWGPNEGKAPVTKQAGLWELPAYVYLVPPQHRAAMKERASYFDTENGKITGFDYNLLAAPFLMNKEQYLDTLKYTLDQRLAGNRAPMLLGVHTDYYSPEYKDPKNISSDERREVIEAFMDYALTKQGVRLRSYKQVLDWMRKPTSLKCQ